MSEQFKNIILPKKLFLIDSLGALISALFLGVVLVEFESTFGMPSAILKKLAIAAIIFAAYSGTCYLLMPKKWQPFLRLIAIVNLSYSCLTIYLMHGHADQFTVLGYLYFVGELIIVISLALYELKVSLKKQS